MVSQHDTITTPSNECNEKATNVARDSQKKNDDTAGPRCPRHAIVTETFWITLARAKHPDQNIAAITAFFAVCHHAHFCASVRPPRFCPKCRRSNGGWCRRPSEQRTATFATPDERRQRIISAMDRERRKRGRMRARPPSWGATFDREFSSAGEQRSRQRVRPSVLRPVRTRRLVRPSVPRPVQSQVPRPVQPRRI